MRTPRFPSSALTITIAVILTPLASAAPAYEGATPPPTPPLPSGQDRPITYDLKWAKGSPLSVTRTTVSHTARFKGSGTAAARRPSSNAGASHCYLLMAPPEKEVIGGNPYIVGDSTVTCTRDVDHIVFTQYLVRGLNNGVIIAEKDVTEEVWWADATTVGPCASSTWAYYDWIPQLFLCSTVNGCIVSAGLVSDYHYWSC